MAGAIRLVPVDERGQQIIDELEEKAGERPTEIQEDEGAFTTSRARARVVRSSTRC